MYKKISLVKNKKGTYLIGYVPFLFFINKQTNDFGSADIRIARLERAAIILLENDEVRIRDVAYELGFSTPSYFTRCFMQHYGMTPKDYVASKKNENSSSD